MAICVYRWLFLSLCPFGLHAAGGYYIHIVQYMLNEDDMRKAEGCGKFYCRTPLLMMLCFFQ